MNNLLMQKFQYIDEMKNDNIRTIFTLKTIPKRRSK